MYVHKLTTSKFHLVSEKTIEYDADSEDDEWLKENGEALKLTHDDFEKYMEFLENKSGETKVN